MRRDFVVGLLGLLCSSIICGTASGAVAHATNQARNQTGNNAPEVYRNAQAPLEQRVQDLVSRMTLEEKVDLLGGTGFDTVEIPRLGLPSIKMADGPIGVRYGKATAFPAAISLGASFNPDLIGEAAKAMAEETKAYGRNMLLGPCIGIARHPFGGRNFESYGEDPFLNSILAVSYIHSLQGQGVLASTKHYAVNDQEFKRMTIDTIVDERTMQEIHLPMFHAAVKAGTWSVMASYNKFNGLYATENHDLLTRILKNDWGFQGFVVSDWWATHSMLHAARAGLDLEMPTGDHFNRDLVTAVRSGQLSEDLINDKVRRIVRAIIGSGLYDADPAQQPNKSAIGSSAHLQVARKAADEGTVLLKNDGVLPLKTQNIRSMAVIGAGAKFARTGGGGSSLVIPTRAVSPLEVLKNRLGSQMQIGYAVGAKMTGDFEGVDSSYWTPTVNSQKHGVFAEYFANKTLQGKPYSTRLEPALNFDWAWSSPDAGIPTDGFSARFTGYLTPDRTGRYNFTVRADDGVRVWIDDKLILDEWFDHALYVFDFSLDLQAGRPYKVKVEYYENSGHAIVGMGFTPENKNELQEAVALASQSDIAVVFAGLSPNFEAEDIDRGTMSLPEGQDELIRQVAAANPNTIVVINAGNPIAMPWLNQVKALVYAWYPGQEGGESIVDVLTGAVNPSGKLPVSFPKRWEDSAAYGAYPEDQPGSSRVTYREGIYVGYRHFDSRHIEPLFPFGFGLSYTTFALGAPQVRVVNPSAANPQVELSVDVTNSGSRAGAEVVQLYVRELNPKVNRPMQELKAFKKVRLAPGQSQRVTLTLDRGSFAYYDVGQKGWNVNPGAFELRVGTSSRDIRATQNVVLK